MGDGGSGWSPRPSGPGRAPPPSGTQRQWRCPRGRVYPNSPRPLAGSAEPWRGSVRGEYRSGVNLCVPSISDTERRRPLGISPRPQLPPGGPMRRPDMRVALGASWRGSGGAARSRGSPMPRTNGTRAPCQDGSLEHPPLSVDPGPCGPAEGLAGRGRARGPPRSLMGTGWQGGISKLWGATWCKSAARRR